MESLALIVFAMTLVLAMWGDRMIAKKRGYDKLSKKEIKKLNEKKAEEMAKKIPNWVWWGVLLCFLFLLFKGCSAINLGGDKNTEAYYMCKQFIAKRLNDPKSLDFPNSNTARITNNGDTYNITGTFRANNAFGAKIQNTFSCRVAENRDRGTWSLLYLSEF